MVLAKEKFKFYAWVQKCHFGEIKICQNTTFEPMHENRFLFVLG
jgi:hypothetical protein